MPKKIIMEQIKFEQPQLNFKSIFKVQQNFIVDSNLYGQAKKKESHFDFMNLEL